MKWVHECSLDWMKARQKCLTASDIKDLLPITSTGKSRKISDFNYLKVYARKNVILTKDDCFSTGVAARGHLLEPYAIEFFNEHFVIDPEECLYHWDDVILQDHLMQRDHLGFSPDACNFKMPNIINDSPDGHIFNAHVSVIGEIKCYSPERHETCGHTPKNELEERWQIATAMATERSIEYAYLIFFNPSMVEKMYVVKYNRRDLDEEIEIIKGIEKNWLDFIHYDLTSMHCNLSICDTDCTEQSIIDKISATQRLNP